MNIPDSMVGSKVLQFIQSQGWNYKYSSDSNIILEHCPFCKKEYHCYVEVHGPSSGDLIKRDSLFLCHRCGAGGNLYTIKKQLGLVIEGVQSRNEWSSQMEPLPNIEECHQALLEDSDTMDYLVNNRGFSREIISKFKLGITNRYFKECGEVKALIYPYFVGDNVIFVHYRSLPPAPKSFSSPKGYDVPLFNGQVLKEGIKEITIVEGEANVIAALDKGYTNICGVPGANIKKAEWIDTLDKLELEKIYICYDNDKVGQKAAQALASRIGVEKCWKVVLPPFTVQDDNGETKEGKDINEYFASGRGTAELFSEIVKNATLFDVDGVVPPSDALQEFEDLINNKGLTPQYSSPWPSLNKFIGFDDADVIDIIAPAKVGKTTVVLNLLEHLVDTTGEDGCLICLEMSTVKLTRKLVSHIAQVADNIPKTVEEAENLKQEFLLGISHTKKKFGNREGELLLCYPKYKKIDDLYKLMIDIIRRYGVKFIAFDNIQRAADTTVGGKNRTQHLSEISKVTSQIAKDYGVLMFRIIQPHQIKPGQLTKSNDADGSSQISKDCDGSLTLDRNKVNEISAQDFDTLQFVESESAFGDRMLVNVDLSRYSAGGYTTLRMDGARSTVTEYDAAQIAQIRANVDNVGHNAALQRLGASTEDIKI